MASHGVAPGGKPAPRFNLESIFREVFSCEEAATFLFSREQVPPTRLTSELMNESITVDSHLTSDTGVAAFVMKKANDARLYEDLFHDNESDHSEWNKNVNEAIPVEVEHMVFVLHHVNERCAFMTCTDDRTPLAFMEKAGELVVGVRRVVTMELYEQALPNTHIQICNYWMPDGRSCITILLYALEPVEYSEKYLMLLAPYPESRYPRVSDILECLSCIEQHFCTFCTLRKSPVCECAPAIAQRTLLPPIPPKDRRNPWQLHKWHWDVFDRGMKFYQCLLQNFPKKIDLWIPIYHQITTTFKERETHVDGFKHYLKILRPFVDEQLISWGNVARYASTAKSSSSTDLVVYHTSNIKNNTGMNFAYQEGQVTIDELEGLDNSINDKQMEQQRQGSRNNSNCMTKKRPMDHDMDEEVDADEGKMARTGPSAKEKQIIENYFKQVESCLWPNGQPRPCLLCNKEFHRKHDLKRHIRSLHLNERSFVCDICLTEFTRKNRLEAHIKSVHEGIIHLHCPVCDREYINESSMRKHVRRNHPKDVEPCV
mmetsp:Transcript_5058/g.9245  ORF Transcript_5058/g.9245 Transcript_5058/m.9245 type:complete len:543 (-) Transcript_5058:50-1678(-)